MNLSIVFFCSCVKEYVFKFNISGSLLLEQSNICKFISPDKSGNEVNLLLEQYNDCKLISPNNSGNEVNSLS